MTIKIRQLSDIHTEWAAGEDVLVLAGDIGNPKFDPNLIVEV